MPRAACCCSAARTARRKPGQGQSRGGNRLPSARPEPQLHQCKAAGVASPQCSLLEEGGPPGSTRLGRAQKATENAFSALSRHRRRAEYHASTLRSASKASAARHNSVFLDVFRKLVGLSAIALLNTFGARPTAVRCQNFARLSCFWGKHRRLWVRSSYLTQARWLASLQLHSADRHHELRGNRTCRRPA
eukprot:15476026-Alexandrium_andersonii.AAC.1